MSAKQMAAARPNRADRGIALPLAIVALMILTVLVIALVVLATSEPPISSNHARAAQARAFAHAGVARALWALGQPEARGGIPVALSGGSAAAPYDGLTFVGLGDAGGFFVHVAGFAGTESERAIDATGWTPGPPAPDRRIRAHRRIRAVMARLRFPDPPAALSAGTDVEVHGTSRIDVPAATCGPRAGAVATGDVHVLDAAAVHGSGDVSESGAVRANQPTAALEPLAFTAAELDLLRALARCCGTYVGPGSPATWTDAPRVTFDTTTRLPRPGLVFVDTRTAAPPTVSTPAGDLADVLVTGDASPSGEPGFQGWLVVNGHVTWQGSMPARGLVYAQGGLTWAGTGAFTGAVVARNATGTAGVVNVGPAATIAYDCEAARTGGGTLPASWFVKPGSYREVAD
jgi:hypothetical protein